jgi:hypothetical protein
MRWGRIPPVAWTSRVRDAIFSVLAVTGVVAWLVWARCSQITDRIVRRLRDDALAREAIIGLVLAVIGVAVAVWIGIGQNRVASDLEKASEIQENVRFVRQSVINPGAPRPFSGLNLSGAYLSGLDLGCYRAGEPSSPLGPAPTGGICTDFAEANLSGAFLIGTDLTGANLTGADLSGADLAYANLHGADLSGADLRDAKLTYANLRTATLPEAKLMHHAELSGVCYNEHTFWPAGIAKPPPECRLWYRPQQR